MSEPIPSNDPSHPRWLLDIKGWRIYPYQKVATEVERTGYGIVSYTWGKWADFDKPAQGVPENLPWAVPTVSGLSVSHARQVLDQAMDIRFVWWDWMCVPQGKRGKVVTVSDELEQVKGEEIAKQMQIYKGARKSIVWLHRTRWNDCPRLSKFLKGEFSPHENFEDILTEIDVFLKSIREDEPWLTSGWTLQEGVLLAKTLLLDHDGTGLRGDFPTIDQHDNDHRATVEHISVPATSLADSIVTAFVRRSEGWSSGSQMSQGTEVEVKKAIDFISASPSNYERAATFISDIIRSGFVCYWPGAQTVLYLLAGALARRFTVPEDQCWALIGALELEGVNPWYSKKMNREEDMLQIKREFFIPLLKKYQWELFLVPEVEDANSRHRTWPERVVHGGVLPLGLYFVQDIWEHLPLLEYDQEADQLVCNSGDFLKLKSRAFFRRYKQSTLDENGAFIHVGKIAAGTSVDHLYLPLRDIPVPHSPISEVEGWSGMQKGLRCVEIQLAGVTRTSGYFRGIVDVWALVDAFETLKLPRFNIL